MARSLGGNSRREGSKRRSAKPEASASSVEPDRGASKADRPTEPSGWRDVFRHDYDYPAEFDELNRRNRRRARKTWRRDDHAERMAWLRERRQAEPASPAGVIAVVLLIAIIVLGIGGGLPKLLGRDDAQQEPVGLLTPVDPAPRSSEDSASHPPPTGQSSSSTPSTSPAPLQTQRPSAAAVAVASHVVNNWAHTFYTRNPSKETYDQLVARAGKYTTAEMADSFTAAGDSTYDALKVAGGSSVVLAAPVTAPRAGAAPVDTPNRISRFVNIVIDVTGKEPRRISIPLLVTVIPQDSNWVISDVNGGSGP